MNYILLAYIFVILTVVIFSLTFPLEMYAIRKEPREKAVALDYIMTVNALAYASRQAINRDFYFREMLMRGYDLLDERIITKPRIVDIKTIFNSNMVFAKVIFEHPWGNETVVAYLGAKVTILRRRVSIKLALRLYLIMLKVKSDRPVTVNIIARNSYLLMVNRLPDQQFLISLLVPPKNTPVLNIVDERNIFLEVYV